LATRERLRGALRCLAAMLAVLAAGVAAPASADARCRGERATTNVRAFTHAVLCLHNVQRRAHGLAPLHQSRKLRRAARRHAKDMARRHYFGHVTIGGRSVAGRVRRTGYGRRAGFAAGENIFYALRPPFPSPAGVLAAWMANPPHRQQLLNPAWHELGIGASMRPPVPGRAGVTVVAVFGARPGAR
jgi:uncharacterized protein YkwD